MNKSDLDTKYKRLLQFKLAIQALQHTLEANKEEWRKLGHRIHEDAQKISIMNKKLIDEI